MKLHLPSALRKAVLTTLAALTSLLPSTLVSASALSGAAYVTFALVETAHAAGDNNGDKYDGRSYAGEIWVWDAATNGNASGGLGSLALSRTGSASVTGASAYSKYWRTAIPDISTINTLRLTGATGSALIKPDWESYAIFGGIIVDKADADDVVYRINGTDRENKQTVRLQAENTVFISLQENLHIDGRGVDVLTDGDWYLADGKSLTFSYTALGETKKATPKNGYPLIGMRVAEGKTINLYAYENGKDGGTVATDMELTLNDGSAINVDKGVTLRLSGGLNGSGAIHLNDGVLEFGGSTSSVTGAVIIDGTGALEGTGFTLASGSLEFAHTGETNLSSAITVNEGARLIISGMLSKAANGGTDYWQEAKRWKAGKVGGAGTLEWSGLGYIRVYSAATNAMINSSGLGCLEIGQGTAVALFSNETYENSLRALHALRVAEGGSISVEFSNSPFTAKKFADSTIYLSGTGYQKKEGSNDPGIGTGVNDSAQLGRGALVIGSSMSVTTVGIGWDVVLESDAAVCVGRASEENKANNTTGHVLKLTGVYTGGNHELTLLGHGQLHFDTAFNTAGGSSGSFNIKEGTLVFNNTTNADALKNYTVAMEGAAANLIVGNGSFGILTLTGSGAVSATSTGTLVLTQANGAFDGTVAKGVTIAVADGTWKLGKNAKFEGALRMSGGSLDIAEMTEPLAGSLEISADAYIGAATVFKLTEAQLRGFNLDVTLVGFDSSKPLSVHLFDTTGFDLSNLESLYKGILEHIDTTLLSRSQSYVIDKDGVLSIVGVPTDLEWNTGDGVWRHETEANHTGTTWDIVGGASGTYFGNGENVIFNKEAGGTVQVAAAGVTASQMTIEAGSWKFDNETDKNASVTVNSALTVKSGAAAEFAVTNTTIIRDVTVEDKASLTFSGKSVSIGGALNVGAGAMVEVSSEGAKIFNGITLGDDAEFVVKVASGWNGSGAVVRGNGTLVLDGIDTPFSNSKTRGDFEQIVKNLLAQNEENSLAKLELRHGADAGIYSDWSEWLKSAKTISVTDGSSLAIGSIALNTTREHTLLLDGAGKDGKGALYIDAGCTVQWGIELAATGNGATITAVGGANGTSAYTLTLTGNLNGNGKTLTIGGGTVKLGAGFDTGGSSGHINVDKGTLELQYTTAADTPQALETWTLHAEKDTTITMGGSAHGYMVGYLSGEGTLNGSNTLIIKNTNKNTKTFSGVINTGATVEVAQGVWSVKAAEINGNLRLSGGTLDASGGGVTLGADSILSVNAAAYAGDGAEYALKVTSDMLTSGLAEHIALEGVDFSGDVSGFSMKLLDMAGLSGVDLASFADSMDRTMLGRSQAFLLDESGILTITGVQTELVWGGGSGTWLTEGSDGKSTAWNRTHDNTTESTHFESYENATFGVPGKDDKGTITLNGDVAAGKMTVVNGEWTFEADAEKGGSLTVNGELSLSGGQVAIDSGAVTVNGKATIESGARLALNTTMAKTFAQGITVQEGGVLALANTTALTGSVSGAGTLELHLGGMGGEEGSQVWRNKNTTNSFGTLLNVTNGNYAHDIVKSGTVKLADTLIQLNSSGSQHHVYYSNIKRLHVAAGSTVLHRLADIKELGASCTLILEGNGGFYRETEWVEGALAFGFRGGDGNEVNASTYYLMSAVELADDASIYVQGGLGANKNTNHVAELAGTITANQHTLTKKGEGILVLNNADEGFKGGKGAAVAESGTLRLDYTAGAALEEWDVRVAAAGTLQLGSGATAGYTLARLSGEGSVSVVSGNTTLTLSNADTAASKANTFTGAINIGVTIALAGGYAKLAGELADGSHYAATGGSTLALAGKLTGAHSIAAADAVVDLAGAEAAGDGVVLQLTTSGTGVINNLSLGAGATLGAAAGSKAADAVEGAVLLGGTVKLAGGSTLQFDVAPDAGGDGWHTATQLVISGKLDISDASDSAPISLHVDPYARMDDGSVAMLGVGSHVLIEGAGLSADELLLFDGLFGTSTMDKAAGGTPYSASLGVDADGNLVLTVEEAAATVVWDDPDGGTWSAVSSDRYWRYAGSAAENRVAFRNGDVVIFDTLEGVSSVTVKVSDVKPGAVTVTGKTDYVLDGSIGGLDDGAGAGLMVGTPDAAFEGTLTLTSANGWNGGTVINSGTVVAQDALALSSGAIELNGGELRLDYDASAAQAMVLSLNGGALTAAQDAEASAAVASGGGALQAANGATLTATLSSVDAAATLYINSAETAGSVLLHLPETSTPAALHARGGKTVLAAADGGKATLTTAATVDAPAELVLSTGMTLAGTIAAEGEVTLQAESALALAGAGSRMAAVHSQGATLSSADAVSSIASLELTGDTMLSGAAGWTVNAADGAANTLTIDGGSAAVVREGRVAALAVGNAATLGTEAVETERLTLGDASDAAEAARLTSGSVTAVAMQADKGVIEAEAQVTLTGSGSMVSGADSALLGTVVVNNAAASAAAAELTICRGATLAGSLDIQCGTVALDDAAVGAATATLHGAAATLDLGGLAAEGLRAKLLGGGTLLQAEAFAGTAVADDAGSGSAVFAMGGLGSEAGLTLTLTAGSRVVGLGEGVHLTGNSTLTLAAGLNKSAEEALLQSTAKSLDYTLDGTLTIVIDAIYTEVREAGEATYYIFGTDVTGSDWERHRATFSASLYVYHFDAVMNADGSITFRTINDTEGNIFVSSEQGDTLLNSYDDLDDYTGVVINRSTTVDLTGAVMTNEHPDGLVMRNVTGTADGALHIEGLGSGQTLVTLRNTLTDEQLADYAERHDLDIDNAFVMANGVNVRNADLQVKHVSEEGEYLLGSRTVMMAGLSVMNGSLLMTSGELELRAQADVDDVHFAGSDGQIIVNATTAGVGSLTVRDADAHAADDGALHAEHIRLENSGVLVLKDGAAVGEGIVIGNTEAVGQVAGTLAVNGESSISARSSLRNLVLHVQGDLTIAPAGKAARGAADDMSWALAGMTGAGSVGGSRDIDFAVAGGNRTYSGSLAEYAGTMTFAESPHSQIFAGVTGSAGWNVHNADGGRVVFDLMAGQGSNKLTMGNLTMAKGSFTTIVMDLAAAGDFSGLSTHLLTVESGADVTIAQYSGTVTLKGADGTDFVLGAISADEAQVAAAGVHWHVQGVRNVGDVYVEPDEDGVALKVRIDNSNKYARMADNANSLAGAQLMWAEQESATLGGDMAKLDALLLDLATDGSAEAYAKGNRILAAVAGAGTAVLGQAAAADVDRQLRAIRNRTTTLGAAAASPDDQAMVSAWLNAEGDYRKHKADGMLPGYTNNSWGGTVGVAMEQNDGTSLGLALTAMYGDLESNAADRLKGDMDTMYLSAFAQMSSGAWRHTLVCTAGRVDMDVNRTVSYSSGSYTTQGSTEGTSFGLLYEVGYAMALNEDASVCLQPVVNAAWRYSRLNAYTESGSNAALKVDAQTYHSLTLGAGARVQAAVGANAWNRTGILEARALVKVEMGDRRGDSRVSFAQNGSHAATVRSAEQGVVGVELGASITAPLGADSALFLDFSADIHAAEVNFNATLGYKVSF